MVADVCAMVLLPESFDGTSVSEEAPKIRHRMQEARRRDLVLRQNSKGHGRALLREVDPDVASEIDEGGLAATQDEVPGPRPPPGHDAIESMSCWVCNGTGSTSSSWRDKDFEKDAKGKGQLSPDGTTDCPICFSSPGKYGVSVECRHLFCEDCK